ncbi:MAG TPA: protein-disulfide reductase DsbD family protein, partial [Candidatus Competibacter phosphatis]|nr:protein-disulfide reductase DsbD family protein [Candidatus Competibacter phosphatis]
MRQRRWARSWLVLLLTLLAGSATAGLFDRFGGASQERILDADQAFQLTISAVDPVTLEARWIIAPGYYLYRDKFKLVLVDDEKTTIARIDIPPGESKEDPYFGHQEVFHHEAVLVAHLRRESGGSQTVRVKADYQGCAEVGVCYPPLSQTVTVALPAPSSLAETADQPAPTPPTPAGERVSETRAMPVPALNEPEPEQDRLARLLGEQRFLAIPAFFGFGLLLAFTPCVFPMVPILSSLIAGQGAKLTRRRAILLSLVYVLAMALTYTVAGVLAALLGQNIQAWFQNPWVIAVFSGMFVLLALSMFGLYDLQLPTYLQHRLAELSNRQRGGQFAGVAIMGFLSALIVGPCVA